MEALADSVAYWHWLVLGLLLVSAEIFTSGFVVLWFGLSALVVGLLSYFVEMSFATQLILWSALSIGDLFIWFKFVQPRFRDKTLSGMSREAVLGQVGMVIHANTGDRGRLRFSMPLLGSDEWDFICNTEVAIGDRVRVRDVSGNTLVVESV